MIRIRLIRIKWMIYGRVIYSINNGFRFRWIRWFRIRGFNCIDIY